MERIGEDSPLVYSKIIDTPSERTHQAKEVLSIQGDDALSHAIGERQVESPRRRIGKLGGGKEKTFLPNLHPETMDNDRKEEGATTSGQAVQVVSLAKPRTGKLGRIGGVKPTASTDQPMATDPSTPMSTAALQRAEDNKVANEKTAAELGGRAEERDLERGVERERETSVERANRVRAELKRDLEEKKKAPAKKKRKF